MTLANGLIIAKPGFDARTCDVKDQVFNSQHNSLKIWMTGNVNISVSAYTGEEGTGIGQVEIAHNLGYVPFFLCFFKLKHASKLWLQDSLDDSMLFGNYINGFAWTDASKLYLKVQVTGNNLDAFTAVGYYKILIDKAFEE